EQQPIFVEYHVPPQAAPGWYTGAVHVTGGISADVPVKLYVHAFSLPSTSSIRSAFGMGSTDPCTAHYGVYTECGGDAGVSTLATRYARLALDHRISLSDADAVPPAESGGSYDWSQWDATVGPMLDGKMGGLLDGAKLTSVRFLWKED